jgi:hypothetical protein
MNCCSAPSRGLLSIESNFCFHLNITFLLDKRFQLLIITKFFHKSIWKYSFIEITCAYFLLDINVIEKFTNFLICNTKDRSEDVLSRNEYFRDRNFLLFLRNIRNRTSLFSCKSTFVITFKNSFFLRKHLIQKFL